MTCIYTLTTKRAILEQQANLTLPYPGEYVTAWGIALDEENALLYVSNANEYVDVFRTSDWSHEHYIEIKVNGTPRAAIGIAVDPAHGYLYTGGYNPYEGGTSHTCLVRTETSVPFASIEEDIQKRVIGIGLDQDTGLVYCTTEHNDFRVYQSSLGDPTDIETADISGPAGVAVPRGDVSYKPDVFVLSKVDNVLDCVSPLDQFTYSISYSANGYADTAVVIIDYLPFEVRYISCTGGGLYNESTHTVTWVLGDLTGGESGTLQIVVEVNYFARPGMTVVNAVEMEGALYYSKRTKDTGICCWYTGETIYVDEDATGFENGTWWDDAYTDLQDALEHVRRCPGAVTAIWVAAGTYKPTQSPSESSETFELIDGVDMYGHFAGIGTYETSIAQRNFENPANETRLEGQIGVEPSSGVQCVVTAKNITGLIFDGFTVRGSYGGAGILIDDCPNADLRILRCKVEDNDQYGIESTAPPLSVSHFELQDCVITGNATHGLYCTRSWPVITWTIFDGDSQTQSGISAAQSAVDVYDSEVKNHTGSGIYASAGNLLAEDCFIEENGGAGVVCSNCWTVVSRCVIQNNAGAGLGLDLSELEVTECNIRSNGYDGIYLANSFETKIADNWIYGNLGNGEGPFAGIYVVGAIDQAEIRNNTICNNNPYGIYFHSATEPEVVNCIVYDNTMQIGTASGDPLDLVSYSCVKGGYEGTDNISDAPLFLNAAAGDYHLTWYSPCVDEGKPDSTEEGESDIDGNPRVMGGRVDMGADEDYPHCDLQYDDWVSFGRPNCWMWDYQCDGDADGINSGVPYYYRVYTGDIGLIIPNWRKKMGDPALNPCADIDHISSGAPFYYRVYTGDVAKVIANWRKKDGDLPGNCANRGCQRGALGGGSPGTQLTSRELLDRLAEIWLDPEVRKSIDEEKFLKVYESLKGL
jgi:parallel beta-helix repeat protein